MSFTELDPSAVSKLLNAKITVLEQLVEYLFDPDHKVMQDAVTTLQVLMQADSDPRAEVEITATQILEKKDRSWPASAYLKSFLPKKRVSDRGGLQPHLEYPKPTTPLLWTTAGKPFNEWVVALCCSFTCCTVKDPFLNKLSRICELKPLFAETLLPYIVYDSLRSDPSLKAALSGLVKGFFSRYQTEDVRALQAITNCVTFLRRAIPPAPKGREKSVLTPFQGNFWMDLDFLDVVHAAQRCGLYEASLLFLEVWFENKDKQLLFSGAVVDRPTAIEELLNTKVSSTLQMLVDAYTNLSEPDGLHGLASASRNFALQVRRVVASLLCHWEKTDKRLLSFPVVNKA